MSSLNKAQIIGRLGQDPEMRAAASGTAVVNLSVATSEKYKGEDRTEWHRMVAFGKTGELIHQYLHKGSLAYFEGRLQTRKWQAQDGSDRWSTEIIVNDVQFLSPKSTDEPRDPRRSQTPPAEQTPKQEDGFDDIPF